MSNTVTIDQNKEVVAEIPDLNIDNPVRQDVSQLSDDNIQQLLRLAEALKDNPNYDPNVPVQVVAKEKVKIEVDFSKISESDIWNMDLIEARGFLSSDVLKAELADSNYVARWVNKNPKRLGSMIARGFTYVGQDELLNALNQSVSLDSSGHFAYDDVVLMKIPKYIYFPALKKAQNDAESVINQVKSGTFGKTKAQQFMQHEAGGEYGQAAQDQKVSFYNPPVGA